VQLPLKQARIIQAADAIAYLPLYVAEDQQFKLDRGIKKPILHWHDAFGEPARSPPEEYVSHLSANLHRTGDLGCLNAIVHAWEKDQQPLIGICDPIGIERWDYESKLAIVGGFIRRACFWCLTDQVSTARGFSDLDIDSLFIHDAGFSTGHAIGEQIAGELRQQVDIVTGSFELLVDGAVWQKKTFPSRKLAAISASILSCVIAKNRQQLRVAFPLHSVDEYSEFLSTAIVVPRQCLEDEGFRDAVTLLVLALQEAVNYLEKTEAQGTRKLMELVNNDGRFAQERIIDSAEVVDSKVVPLRTGALAIADENLAKVSDADASLIYKSLVNADLYARDGRIETREWENAWRTRPNKEVPPLARFFDRRILDQASMQRIVGGVSAQPPRSRFFLFTLLIIAAVLFVGLQFSGFMAIKGPWVIAAIGALAMLYEFRSGVDRGLHRLFRNTLLRQVIVSVALLVSVCLVAISFLAIIVATIVFMNEDTLTPEFMSGKPLWLSSPWLEWAPRLSHEWHLVVVGCSALLGLASACAGLTPFGRRARRLFGLLGGEHARKDG